MKYTELFFRQFLKERIIAMFLLSIALLHFNVFECTVFHIPCIIRPTKLRPTAVATKYYNDFYEFYPKLVDNTLMNYKGLDYSQSMKSYFKRMLEYFILCKLPVQGEFLVYAYELLEDPGKMTDEKLYQVYALASATESIQGGWAIQDDYFDSSQTRANKVSWHLLPDTSKKIANDFLIVRHFSNEMIRQNVDKSIYLQIMDVINDMNLLTEFGQFLDNTFPLSHDNFNRYTMKNYETIAFLKASFYAIRFPLQLALVMCNKASDETFRLVEYMCDDLGVFIQVNNDFSEYRAYNESVPFVLSSDFEAGTCTWSAVKALETFDEDQKRIFRECYGNADPEKIKRVIKLYDEVNLSKLYKEEEDKRYGTFLEKVRNLPEDSVPSREFFMKIFDFFRHYMSITTKFYYKND